MPEYETPGVIQAEERFQITGPLVFETVAVLAGSLPDAADSLQIDLGKVTEADSSALTLFLEWQRQAKSRQIKLKFINWPGNLKSLLDLYNLEPILMAESNQSG